MAFEDIIRDRAWYAHPDIKRDMLAQAVAAEREACAKLVEEFRPIYHSGDEMARECGPMSVCDEQATLAEIAKAIRDRATVEETR